MPLDNAQFISELSVTDPEGTDPLNQGDDQIRTTKRATQQSFPNIDAAVPQTAAQMAQMAIKNEANLFTLTNTFNGTTFQVGVANFSTTANFAAPIFLPDGTEAAPAFRFTGQNNTGMYRPNSTQLAMTVAGVQRFRATSDGATVTGQINTADGVAATPAYGFTNAAGMGFFRTGSTSMGLAFGGINKYVFESDALRVPDGSEAFPGMSFLNNTQNGFFLNVNGVTCSVNGVTVWAMSTNGMFAGLGFQISGAGDLDQPTFPGFAFGNDSDTGMYRAAANILGFSAGGLVGFQIGNAGLFAGTGFRFQADGANNVAAAPQFTFSNDTDTGMFRRASNSIGWAVGGQDTMWLLGGSVSSTLNLNQTGGTGAGFNSFKDGVLRWGSGGAGVDQETWNVTRFNDAGGFLNNPISVLRATGVITLNNIPTTNPGGTNRLWKSGGFVAIT